jgi:hypothetical protein
MYVYAKMHIFIYIYGFIMAADEVIGAIETDKVYIADKLVELYVYRCIYSS